MVLLGRRNTYWRCVETLVKWWSKHLLDQPVFSLAGLCLITSVHDTGCMKPSRRRRVVGVCREIIPLLCGNSSTVLLRGCAREFRCGTRRCAAWERREIGRPEKWGGIRPFRARYPCSSILHWRNVNCSWPLKETTENMHSAYSVWSFDCTLHQPAMLTSKRAF